MVGLPRALRQQIKIWTARICRMSRRILMISCELWYLGSVGMSVLKKPLVT